jgi:hypothetical protein
MRTRTLAGCLLSFLLIAATACSKPDDGKDVASVGGTAVPSATPSLSKLDQMVRYTRCMREHGVPMTDPVADGTNVRRGTVDKDAAGDKLFPAEDACKQFLPPQETGTGVDEKNELARLYSRCMREHGVEKFPDPGPDGTRVPSEVGEDPQYPQARAACDAQINAAWASTHPSAGTKK